ncbi:MAG: cobalt transporter CbiM [Firmicutes bacterium]|nr:cobalt transporter CbiM [Bacillota bacterium]
MHIPEGYLSPSTCLAMGAACVPFLRRAMAVVQQESRQMLLPRIALAAAFSFAIQMINVPVPDGTTAHATGTALAAIVLGPWAALLALTVTLAIQALVFADGGILALGANVFNIGVLESLSAWALYRLLTRGPGGERRRVWAAAAAAFVSINLSALATGVELGLQPLLFRAPDGTPLYAPYPLSLAVPAMLYAHLLVAGPLNALVTGLAVRYLIRTGQPLYGEAHPAAVSSPAAAADGAAPAPAAEAGVAHAAASAAHAGAGAAHAGSGATQPPVRNLLPRWALMGLGLTVLATPLGLLPEGAAWGEWGPEELEALFGYVPEGLRRWAGFWQGLIADYEVPGLGDSLLRQAIGYWLSAAVGIGLIALTFWLVARVARPSRTPGR